MRIKWKNCSEGSENWAVYHGELDGRLRFTVIGERFGSKVDGWSLTDFRGAVHSHGDKKRLSDAKSIAQKVVDDEQVFIDLAKSRCSA